MTNYSTELTAFDEPGQSLIVEPVIVQGEPSGAVWITASTPEMMIDGRQLVEAVRRAQRFPLAVSGVDSEPGAGVTIRFLSSRLRQLFHNGLARIAMASGRDNPRETTTQPERRLAEKPPTLEPGSLSTPEFLGVSIDPVGGPGTSIELVEPAEPPAPEHCWHADPASLDMNSPFVAERRFGEVCCWCDAFSVYIETEIPAEGHGPYAHPMTVVTRREIEGGDVPCTR